MSETGCAKKTTDTMKKITDNIKKKFHCAGRHAVASKLAVVVGIGDYNAKKTKEGLVCEQICIMTHFWV